MTLTADELLAGAGLTYEVEVPAEILQPGEAGSGQSVAGVLRLRPLTVRDLQLITRAARESDSLLATLMVQRAVVEPELTIPQVSGLHVGLLDFLLDEVNRISGITATEEELDGALDAPLAKAAFVLAQEYGWTPHEVSELTVGQMLVHLQMIAGSPDA